MKTLWSLNKYFKKYRWRLILGAIFVAASNLFAIYPAQVIRHAFELVGENLRFSGSLNGSIAMESFSWYLIKTAAWFALLIFAMALVKGFFMFCMRQTIIVMSRLIERDMKNEIFRHYQALSLSFYRRNATGDLMARISEDVGRVRMYTGPAIMYTLNLVIMFVLVLGTMIAVNPRLTLFALVPLPIMGYLVFKLSTKIESRSDAVQEKLSGLSTFVQEAFSGTRILKAFVREEKTADQFGKISHEYRNESMKLASINALFAPSMILLVGLSTLLTIYVGGREVMAGRASFGTIAEFVVYVNMLTWPFAMVGWVTSLVQRAAASQKRIDEFLHEQPEIVSPTEGDFVFPVDIEFKNVSVVYPNTGIKALKNFSIRIPSGTSLAVVGRTGSGKTTLGNLLTRMIDPTEGKILLGGKNLKEIPLSALRQKTGFVPQDVFLFSDTLSNNISFGADTGTGKNQIEKAAKDASVYENIMGFPNQFETLIGERGVTLSGGQKQRIAIARALIREPEILILDDCLSAVDTHTEEKILNALSGLTKNRTVVFISHRVSTIKMADNIVVLEEGKLVEQGTHSELLLAKGYYHSMYQLQLFEEETADHST